VRGLEPGRINPMPTPEEHILSVLSEALEPLYSSDIAARLNHELGEQAYWPMDVVKRMHGMADQVIQSSDGRWTLKRLIRTAMRQPKSTVCSENRTGTQEGVGKPTPNRLPYTGESVMVSEKKLK